MRNGCAVIIILALTMVTTPTAWASTAHTDVNIAIDNSAPVGGQVSIEVDSPTQITVTPDGYWDEAAGLHSTAFRFRRDGIEFDWMPGNLVDTDLVPNTLYIYQVKVRDGVGNETVYFDPIGKYTIALDPINLSFESRTENSLTIGIISHLANGTPPEYQLELKSKGPGQSVVSPFSSQTSHRVIGGLRPATEYEVWVTTRNGDGMMNRPYLAMDSIWTARYHGDSSDVQIPQNTLSAASQAAAAVQAVEVSPSDSSLETARRALKQMPDGPERKDLELRLTKVEAVMAVRRVEVDWMSSDLDKAAQLVQQVQDEKLRTELSGRLTQVRNARVITEAVRQPIVQVVPVSWGPYSISVWAVYLAGRLSMH